VICGLITVSGFHLCNNFFTAFPAANHLFPALEVKHFLPEQKEAALQWIQEEVET
jgi:hypothetical protein